MAPTGSGFWHRLLVNIPATVSELAEGAGSTGGKLPAGALQTRTNFGAPGYGGPCPPQGDHPHRYLFTVFAVKVDRLNVTADTSAAVVGFNLPGSLYRSGRSPHWVKVKNPKAPAVTHEADEDWGR
jgi:Raf kinase inhibitor-like YbhB/YbcL family protein